MSSQNRRDDGRRADWRKPRQPVRSTKRTARRKPGRDYTRFMLLGTCAMVVVWALGWFIWTVIAVPMPTPLVAVAVKYGDEIKIAPNAYALEDHDTLDALGTLRKIEVSTTDTRAGEDFLRKLKDSMEAHLRACPPGGPDRSKIFDQGGAVLIYLSGHGGLDANGQPCLLTGYGTDEFDPWKGNTWLPVSELLAYIDGQALHPDVKKVVILDIARVPTQWNLGILSNAFVERIADAIPEDAPNLAVITATSNDAEISWAAPELNGTVFTHFLARGLAGEANVDQDDGITLSELESYLVDRVSGYVRRHYGSQQTPTFHVARDQDFALAYAPDAPFVSAKGPSLSQRINDYEQRSAKLWDRAGELAARGARSPVVTDPVAWNELQFLLLRMDDYFLAGKAYREACEKATEAIERMLVRMEVDSRTQSAVAFAPVAWIAADHADLAVPEQLAAWREWKDAKTPAAEPAERQATDAESDPAESDPAESDPAESIYRIPELDVHVATATVWQDLLVSDEALDASRLQTAITFVQDTRTDADRPADPPELALLKLLSTYLDWNDPKVTDDQRARMVRKLLDVFGQTLLSVAPVDSRTIPQRALLRERCDDRLRQVIDLFLVGGEESLAKADQLLTELLHGTETYNAVLDAQETMSAALLLRDELLSGQPCLLEWLVACRDAPYEQYREFASTFRRFVSELERPATGDGGRDLTALMQDTTNAYRRLVRTAQTTDDETLSVDLQRARLRLPLLRDLSRGRWMREYLTSLTQINVDEGKSQSEMPPGPSSSASIATRLEAIDRATGAVRTLPRIYLDEVAESDGELDTARLGSEIRQRMSNTRLRFSDERDVLQARIEDGVKTDEATWRDVRNLAARQARTMRSELAFLPDSKPDGRWFDKKVYHPQDTFARMMRVERMLTHARRTARDSWGAVSLSNWTARRYPESVAEAYFHRVGDQLQKEAAALLSSGVDRDLFVDAGELVWGSLTEQLNRRRDALAAWGASYADSQVKISPPVGFPEATGTLWYITRRRASNQMLSFDGDSRPLRIALPDPSGTVALFRGHLQPLDNSVPIVTPWYRPVSESQVLVLPGDGREVSVMFVLDCSGSMDRGMMGETRWVRATSELISTLNRLRRLGQRTQRARLNVGLTAYGFQRGFGKDRTLSMSPVWDEEFSRDPVRLVADDVRTLVPLGASDNAIPSMNDWIAKLRPWGGTPLYRAIDRSMEGSPSHVVVITDGENNTKDLDQPNGDADGDASALRSIDSRLRDSQTQFHVILFGPDGNAEKLSKDLKIRSQSDRRHVYTAQNAQSLADALRASLGIKEYRVTSGTDPGAKPAVAVPLDQPVPVRIERPGRANNLAIELFRPTLNGGTLRFAQQSVTLEGGESLMFHLNEVGGGTDYELVPAFLDSRAGPHDRTVSGVTCGLDVRLEDDSSRTGRSLLISIPMRSDTLHLARPDQVWVSARPIDSRVGGRKFPVYQFLDRTFELGTHDPVLQFRAEAWPRGADQVNVEVLFRREPVLPGRTLRPGELSQPLTIHGVDWVVDREATSGKQLVVEETHRTSATLGASRVDALPLPAQIERRWYVEENPPRARHVFTYPEDQNLRVVRLHVMAKSEFVDAPGLHRIRWNKIEISP